jgi:uncharacterized protein (TIGR02284 family)
MSNGIDCLNGLLRGEISAVETYNVALKSLDSPELATTLQQCQTDHNTRVLQLRQKLASLGATPAESSGTWGAFARFMESTAAASGDKPSIDMLEEGEDHGLQAYRTEIDKCDDGDIRIFIKDLLPAQERTHEAMSTLKRELN